MPKMPVYRQTPPRPGAGGARAVARSGAAPPCKNLKGQVLSHNAHVAVVTAAANLTIQHRGLNRAPPAQMLTVVNRQSWCPQQTQDRAGLMSAAQCRQWRILEYRVSTNRSAA